MTRDTLARLKRAWAWRLRHPLTALIARLPFGPRRAYSSVHACYVRTWLDSPAIRRQTEGWKEWREASKAGKGGR